MAPHHPDGDAPPTVCRLCGTAASPTELVLGWSWENAGDGVDTALCPVCARRHVRDIECRLDP